MAEGGEASSSAPGGETVLGRRGRGEAFDDEAPTVMAEGGEASSSAPPAAKRKRGRKKTGRKAQMGADQRSDEIRREREQAESGTSGEHAVYVRPCPAGARSAPEGG